MQKKFLLFSLIILFVFGVSASIYIVKKNNTASTLLFLSNSLKEIGGTEYVSIDSVDFEVSSGVIFDSEGNEVNNDLLPIIQLAYTATLIRRDPILGLSGTNPDSLDLAITEFEEIRDKLSKMQKKDAVAAIVSSALYPTKTLRTLSETERIRQDFLSNVNYFTMERYNTALMKAIESFDADLENHKEAFEAFVPNKVVQYMAGETRVERDVVISILEDMTSNINKARKDHKKRKKCLSGVLRLCRDLSLQLPTISIPDSKRQEKSMEHIKDIYSLIFEVIQKEEDPADPFVELISSSCVGTLDSPQIFATYDLTIRRGLPSTRVIAPTPVFIGGLRIIETKTYANSGISYFDYFIDNEIEYLPANLVTFYTCPEIIIDYGNIFGTLLVQKTSRNLNVSNYVDGKESEEILRLERLLASESNVVREQDALNYISKTLSIVDRNVLPIDIANELIEVSLAVKNNTTHFESLIHHITLLQGRAAGWVDLTNQTNNPSDHVEAPFLFYTRSGFFSLFLGGHSSVLGKDRGFFEHVDIPRDEQSFVFYSDIKDSINHDTLIKNLRFFYKN